MTKVKNDAGQTVDFESAASIMDDELREQLHSEWDSSKGEQDFFDAYCELHLAKYGEEFPPNDPCGQW